MLGADLYSLRVRLTLRALSRTSGAGQFADEWRHAACVRAAIDLLAKRATHVISISRPPPAAAAWGLGGLAVVTNGSTHKHLNSGQRARHCFTRFTRGPLSVTCGRCEAGREAQPDGGGRVVELGSEEPDGYLGRRPKLCKDRPSVGTLRWSPVEHVLRKHG